MARDTSVATSSSHIQPPPPDSKPPAASTVTDDGQEGGPAQPLEMDLQHGSAPTSSVSEGRIDDELPELGMSKATDGLTTQAQVTAGAQPGPSEASRPIAIGPSPSVDVGSHHRALPFPKPRSQDSMLPDESDEYDWVEDGTSHGPTARNGGSYAPSSLTSMMAGSFDWLMRSSRGTSAVGSQEHCPARSFPSSAKYEFNSPKSLPVDGSQPADSTETCPAKPGDVAWDFKTDSNPVVGGEGDGDAKVVLHNHHHDDELDFAEIVYGV